MKNKYQLLNDRLEVIKETKTMGAMLEHTDTLPLMGKGLYIFNRKTSKSVQLV